MQRSIMIGVAACAALAGFAFELWRGEGLRTARAAAAANVAGVASAADAVGAAAVRVAEPPVGATLLPGLERPGFRITTASPEAQRWFDQGLTLTYGFNHDAAARSFLKAAEIDPSCAMCWWGAALVLGPHLNAAMEPGDAEPAWVRLQRAQALAPRTSPREQAFIEALAARYAEEPPADRRPLDEAYARATGELVKRRPDDLDAAVFHAEALMDLQPWDNYDADLQPKGHTAEVVRLLESVMKRDPNHAGALHLYVHAVEASAAPQRGVAAADRLRTLLPGSGHLVHMPAHIYARVGRWHDAVLANEAAVKADDTYLSMCGRNTGGVYPLGYVPHNHHFLWFAASMAGAGAVARAAALETAKRTDLPELMRRPGFAGLQNYWMTPWLDRVRFGRWAEIEKLPNPAPDLPYATAIWHYARAMAALRGDRTKDAEEHHAALARLAADRGLAELTVWDRYPLSLGVRVAEHTVRAELALARGEHAAAIAALEEAVRIEDSIPYDEPPGWHAPVRQTLGVVLLAAGRPADAERVYRDELRRNPANGWSLHGLAAALEAQGRTRDAAAARREQQSAWAHADVQLASSRL